MLFYRVFLYGYRLLIGVAAWWQPKARSWIEGRRGWQERMQTWRAQHVDRSVLWMHCASLGEFEQGRPVLEAWRQERPEWRIVVSFYSPSGYEQRKHYAGADFVTYLPLDLPRNARRFVDTLQPDLVVFVKYEIWYYHLRALFEQDIPTYLISAVFRPDQFFFQVYGQPFRQLLTSFRHIFVQDIASQEVLAQQSITAVTVAGDTRVDRTLALPEQPFADPVVAAFAAGRNLLVAGSSWQPDEAILLHWLSEHAPADWAILLAPHEIGESHIEQILHSSRVPTCRYTQTDPTSAAAARLLVLDTIGMLNRVYRYGRMAYIGGGFGAGIHNTLEPIAYGLPVLLGPRYEKFPEARWLVAHQGARVVTSVEELQAAFAEWQNPTHYAIAVAAIQQYLNANQGATHRVVEWLLRER